MAVIQRQWRTWLAVVAILAAVFILWGRKSYAVGPVVINSATTFATADASDDEGTDGVFTVHGKLTIASTGSITCNDSGASGASACPITIKVDGDMEIETGGLIQAENNNDGGNGGDINITVGGNFTMDGTGGAGATISSRKTSGAGDTGHGGNITIIVGGVTVTDGIGECNTPTGDVLVQNGATITADSPGEAGNIKIFAGHNITIDGLISSQGTTTIGRGGVIWLDACCTLLIDDDGQVISRGSDPGADLVHLEACVVEVDGFVFSGGAGHNGNPSANNLCNTGRPGKPPFSTGCIEVWSGTTATIDGTKNGELAADTTQVPARTWIDVLANLDITIIGDATLPYPTDNNVTAPAWAVHANQLDQNGTGGQVTVISRSGKVSTTGRAVQANASTTSNGGAGGIVDIEAGGAGAPSGNVDVNDASIQAIGDDSGGGGQAGGSISVKSNGNVTGAPPALLDAHGGGGGGSGAGSVSLQGCAVTYTGGSDPAAGITNACAGVPTLPSPANTLLPPGDCVRFCQPGITPTPAEFTPTPSPSPTPTPFCNKEPVQTVLAGRVPDVIVRTDLGQSIQNAVNTATDSNWDGYIIVGVVNNGSGILGGHVSQRVTVSQVYTKPFLLIGCSVTLHDPNRTDGLPTGLIAASAGSPGNIFIMDLHGADSEVAGWKIEGNGRYVRNTGGSGSPAGIWFVGNSNTMHNGSASFNTGVGLKIDGSFNYATDTDAFGNSSHGVQVNGNSNQILKIDSGDSGKGNGGDGFNVAGSLNNLSEDDAFSNRGNGFAIVGNTNTILKGRSGDSGKGNGTLATLGDGYNVVGFGNAFQESRASANKGDGWDVSGGTMGAPNKFKSILSNTGSSGSATLENAGQEYRLLGYVQNNGGGNKADSVTIPAATKCFAFPASPNTANVNFACGD